MMLYKPLMKRFLNGAKYILPTSPNYLETSETLREIKVPKKVIPMSLNKSDYNIDEENYKYWQQKLNFRDTRFREYDNSIVITNSDPEYSSETTVIPDSDPESPLYNQNYSHWKNNIGFEKFFIYIGALRYYKGLDVLIDAMQGQDYPLVIVGDGYQKELLEQKVKLNKLQNVKFSVL